MKKIQHQCPHDDSQKMNGRCIQCEFFPKTHQIKQGKKRMQSYEYDPEEHDEFETALALEKRSNMVRLWLQYTDVLRYVFLILGLSLVSSLFYFF